MEALGKPRLPLELKRDAGISLTNVSKTLKSLEEKGIAECLKPGDRTGRIYTASRRKVGRSVRRWYGKGEPVDRDLCS